MSKNTTLGKAFTIDELIKLVRIGTFGGDYKNAILGAFSQVKALQDEVNKIKAENVRINELLSNSLNAKYFLEQDIESLKEEKSTKVKK